MEKQLFGGRPEATPKTSFGLSHSINLPPKENPDKREKAQPEKSLPLSAPVEVKPQKREEAAATIPTVRGDIQMGLPTSAAFNRYLQSLNDPDVIPTFLPASFDRGIEHKTRIANCCERISKEIYTKIDPRVFAGDDPAVVRKEIVECVGTVMKFDNRCNLSSSEITEVSHIMESDILGLGPLDELLANDDISDIMVDGPNEVYIEKNGQISKTNIRFRNEDHLLNICYRIVSRVGRHVSMSSPICDARLPDGSRVNIILPPLALHGPALTIRKFKKDKITMDNLLAYGTVDKKTARLLQILAACRVNIMVTGGTGSGKTTLLNCLAGYISPRERIVTCEDVAELQLQQPQVVSLETRPVSIEGVGLITMRDLVRNSLRMRPDRIIVGEVRGGEAFDLIQAMNTGHDGTMGTFHANNPRDALFRLENMVAMADLNMPTSAIRQQISSSVEVVVHTQRLRDGSRKIMNITEIVGMENDVITIQDLVTYQMTGEDKNKRITGNFKFSGAHPRFYEKARRFNFEEDLLALMQEGGK